MGSAGILTEDDRVELIKGEIVSMSPVGARHLESVTTLMELLIEQKPATVRVTMQNPVRLPNDSQPLPDLIVMQAKRYWLAIPAASDVLVVIEVSDTTLVFDQDVKIPLYAAAGIPEAWIVDLPAGRIVRYGKPLGGRYQTVRYFDRGETLESEIVPGLAIPVDTVVGPHN
jgi:Uma2 family endonuclease